MKDKIQELVSFRKMIKYNHLSLLWQKKTDTMAGLIYL